MDDPDGGRHLSEASTRFPHSTSLLRPASPSHIVCILCADCYSSIRVTRSNIVYTFIQEALSQIGESQATYPKFRETSPSKATKFLLITYSSSRSVAYAGRKDVF